jgi:hypothetical protein
VRYRLQYGDVPTRSTDGADVCEGWLEALLMDWDDPALRHAWEQVKREQPAGALAGWWAAREFDDDATEDNP